MVKLSQWHSEKVKPVHKGVYQRLYNEEMDGGSVVYCVWSGLWFCYGNTPLEASLQRCPSNNKTKWRGIVK